MNPGTSLLTKPGTGEGSLAQYQEFIKQLVPVTTKYWNLLYKVRGFWDHMFKLSKGQWIIIIQICLFKDLQQKWNLVKYYHQANVSKFYYLKHRSERTNKSALHKNACSYMVRYFLSHFGNTQKKINVLSICIMYWCIYLNTPVFLLRY